MPYPPPQRYEGVPGFSNRIGPASWARYVKAFTGAQTLIFVFDPPAGGANRRAISQRYKPHLAGEGVRNRAPSGEHNGLILRTTHLVL